MTTPEVPRIATEEEERQDSGSSSSAPRETSTSNSSSVAPRRRVQFHASAKTEDGATDPFGVSIPRRVKLGKGNANPIRDALFLFAFVGMLMYMALSADNMVTKNDQQPRKKTKIALAEEMNKMQKAMARMLMEATEKSRRKESCDVFLAKGSIPQTGYGVFAGRRFLKGEVIYHHSMTVPIELKDGHVEQVSSLALLLKFHPDLSNVENVNTLGEMKLRATRAIKAGEELFLPYEQHPVYLLAMKEHQLFSHIPVISDYNFAEQLQTDIKNAARRMEVAHNRRVQDAITLNTGYLYSLGAQITARFAPNVAKLLPSSRSDLQSRGDLPLRMAALTNQTLAKLQMNGSCLGDVILNVSESNDDSRVSIVATRSVKTNEILQTVPIHLFKSSRKSHSNCFSSKAVDWKVCPLTDIAQAPIAIPSEANVALKWTELNAVKSFRESFMDEAAAGMFTAELVALKPLEVGHKVRF
jgi:hypothetical protein